MLSFVSVLNKNKILCCSLTVLKATLYRITEWVNLEGSTVITFLIRIWEHKASFVFCLQLLILCITSIMFIRQLKDRI